MKIGFDYVGVLTDFACLDEQGRLLMHRRGDKCRDEQGTWDIGGGQLEFDLTLHENVLKEIKEEYGCEGQIIGSLPAIDIVREFDGAMKSLDLLSIYSKSKSRICRYWRDRENE